ncbi:hypothetical protein DFJ43DRAFT_138036 [Lentinula guzmanii]|uniref:Uncharacterized protein n=1 Tax=Lentinula guzmanii TaxID=2804957 RepID=A0AA38J296_9AGAR|nr:hypothetical protein DFJ43DRAFT_1108574 [Lentinula guzmanii]KAJ3710881.1 hypothetical protein DFJ43DRAFT_138036 [Lentinula guzmanii]
MSIVIKWTVTALQDIAQFVAADFGNVDPKEYHEAKVLEYLYTHQLPVGTNIARIRRGAHKGGSDPRRPDHITLSLQRGGHKLQTAHVYTGR